MQRRRAYLVGGFVKKIRSRPLKTFLEFVESDAALLGALGVAARRRPAACWKFLRSLASSDVEVQAELDRLNHEKTLGSAGIGGGEEVALPPPDGGV